MAPVVKNLPIMGAWTVDIDRYHDHRGYFEELYNETKYPEGIRGSRDGNWQQVSLSKTNPINTIRGLHKSPYNKFCSCLSGAIWDVIVDCRPDSPTFMKWCGAYLSEENQRQVHIPANCLHGFFCLEEGTRMLYLQGGTFDGVNESDCNPFDPLIGVVYPSVKGVEFCMSDKDRNAPLLSDESRMPALKGVAHKDRILIVGASGQVGSALTSEYSDWLVYGTHNSNPAEGACTMFFNLEESAKDEKQSEELVDTMAPAVICVCAAYTWVDKVEEAEENEKAVAINVQGPVNLAKAAKRIGAKFVVYSSDYIFDGAKGDYSEDDATAPLNVYGQTKLDMEKAVMEANPDALILRTAVVYGPEKQGKNFVYQLCRKLKAGEGMKVMTDQVSSPTYNRDLAKMTRLLVDSGAPGGIYHACGPNQLSRHEFACEAAKALELDVSLIATVTTPELNQKATRPLAAGMRVDKVVSMLDGFKPKSVAEAIADWQANPGDSIPLGK